MSADEVDYVAAQRLVLEQEQAKARRFLAQLVERKAARGLAYARASAELDRAVASLVTEKPGSDVWYDHPGVLGRDVVQEVTGLNTQGLHRVMIRARRREEVTRARKRQDAKRRARA